MKYVVFLENEEYGFYDPDLNDNIPESAKEIAQTEYEKFHENQGKGIRQKINPETLKIEENPYTDKEFKNFKRQEVTQKLAQIDNDSNSRRSYREAVINKEITVNDNEYKALKALEDEAIALRTKLKEIN